LSDYNPKIENLRPKPWPKGVSGNPAGYSKGRRLASKLRDYLSHDGREEKLLEALYREAEKGSYPHIREILDRIDGKVPSPVEVTEKNESDTGVLVRVPTVSTDGSDGPASPVLE
jgi:hypothetical protein